MQPATFISPTSATFFAPFVREAGRYPAFLTTNGADFTQAASDISLTFHADFTIERLSNYRIQVAHGETVSLTAWGQGLPKAGDIVEFYCIFGPTSAADFETVAVRASLISEDGTSVRCDEAPASFSMADGTQVAGAYTVLLHFSYNLQERMWE